MPAPARTALVVIDAQQEYFAPVGKVVLPDGPAAVHRIARALAWARAEGVPVVHVVHESRRPNAATFAPGSPALEIHPEAKPAPGEPVLTKHLVNRAATTDLAAALDLEAYSQGLSIAADDHQEGIAAFFEKRPPRFTGR